MTLNLVIANTGQHQDLLIEELPVPFPCSARVRGKGSSFCRASGVRQHDNLSKYLHAFLREATARNTVSRTLGSFWSAWLPSAELRSAAPAQSTGSRNRGLILHGNPEYPNAPMRDVDCVSAEFPEQSSNYPSCNVTIVSEPFD